MRHGTANRRQRNNRSNNRRGGQQRSQVFDSNGPDVRIRGTAFQVAEKYEALAKDAASAGDTILAESYLQHAEHYLRVIASWEDSSRPDNSGTYSQEKEDVRQTSQNGSKSGNKRDHEDLGLPSSILGETLEEA